MPARQLESFSVFSALVLLAVTASAPAVAHKEHKPRYALRGGEEFLLAPALRLAQAAYV